MAERARSEPAPPTEPPLHATSRPPRGAGPAGATTVLLVHGTMDRATSFLRMSRCLAEWTVLSYDRRGYAASAPRGPSSVFADQVDDLFEVLDAHGPPAPAKVVAFGHSLGGDVVLAAAQRQPSRFEAVAVYEAPASWEPWWRTAQGGEGPEAEDPSELAEAFMRRMVGDRVWERLPSSTRAKRRAEGATMVAEVLALARQRPFDPSLITVPAVIGRGSNADARQVRAADQLAGTIPGAQLAIVDGADHGAHLSHPRDMAALVHQAQSLVPSQAS